MKEEKLTNKSAEASQLENAPNYNNTTTALDGKEKIAN